MKPTHYELGSGNIFRDLGLADAEELNAKAHLAIKISQIIDKRGLTQTQAAKLLGIDQPKVSAIVRGHLEKFSLEKLTNLLTHLGCDIDIRVHERPRRTTPGKITVSVGDERRSRAA